MAKKQKKKKINITLDEIKEGVNDNQENNKNSVFEQKEKKVHKYASKHLTLDELEKDIDKEKTNDEKIGSYSDTQYTQPNIIQNNSEEKVTFKAPKEIHKNITLDELEKNIDKKDIENNTAPSDNTSSTNINTSLNGDTNNNDNQTSLKDNEIIQNGTEDHLQEENRLGVEAGKVDDKKVGGTQEDIKGNIIGESVEKTQGNPGNINNGIDGNNLNTDEINTNNSENNTPQNEKAGDIKLDNLGTHIDTSTSTINVNDSSFQNTEISSTNNNDSVNITSPDGNSTQNVENQNYEGSELSNGETNGEGLVELDKINIENHNDDDNAYLDLSGGSLYDIKKAPRFKYGKITIFATLISIIALAIGVVAYFYNDFITNDLSNMDGNRAYTFVESAKDFIKKANKSDGNTTIQSVNLIGKNSKKDLDNLINSDLNFIQKKAILNESISNLSNNIISKYTKLNDIKTDVTRYGFFPKDLSHIISESEPISSIQNSLIALEAIKFSSAISVFSYLDTFTTSLVQSLGIERDEIEEKVGKVTSRGETDINIYIKNCYLNPFESDYDCNYIGDFDEYYKNLNDNFDTKFFKELIKYTDSRLEQSEIPSFVITFKEFNQRDNEITFDIEINTLKEDEAELTKKGIISPHIFILQSLINSLRQSRFIVGDDISVKTLNVTQNSYIIGLSEINVNRSVNTFTVHIKKENAVEIDDFVYTDY